MAGPYVQDTTYKHIIDPSPSPLHGTISLILISAHHWSIIIVSVSIPLYS
jgi:hypothetical protein